MYMRHLLTFSILSFVTSALAVSDLSRNGHESDVSVQDFRRNDESTTLNNSSRGHRLLVIPRMSYTDSFPMKRSNIVPSSSTKCQHATSGGCDSDVFTIFSQSYMPTVLTLSRNKQFYREPTSDEVVDWDSNLKILGLCPKLPKKQKHLGTQTKTAFTPEARKEVKEHDWPMISMRAQVKLYLEEWNKNGVRSGLQPESYIREINRLHESHKTPDIIKDATKSSVKLAELKAAFGPNACLICKSKGNEKFFMGVNYCHKVNSYTHLANDVVPFVNCGVCDPRTECNQEMIGIPKLANVKEDKLEMTNTKCQSSTTKDGKEIVSKDCEDEYSIFVQSYLPTMMTTGKESRQRPVTSDEVVDWNSNLKIHGLWPTKSKVTKSTLPFTEEASAAVDKRAWPTFRDLNRKIYLHEWETHGVASGLGPSQYIHEINRLHHLYRTPQFIKEQKASVPLVTLKGAFNEHACLLCRPKDGKQLFLEVKYCLKVNSSTRQAEKVVPFEHCAGCSPHLVCSQEYIIIPKIGKDKSRSRKPQF